MYDGRFGIVYCLMCDVEILPGSAEAQSLYNGDGLAPNADDGSWICGSDCNGNYADLNYAAS